MINALGLPERQVKATIDLLELEQLAMNTKNLRWIKIQYRGTRPWSKNLP